MSKNYIHHKHFSIQEAIDTLQLLKPFMDEMVNLAQYLLSSGYDFYRHKYFGGMSPNGNDEYPKEFDRLIETLKVFDKHGILVKGIEKGLIDFPHLRENGEEVYLCYYLGEESINFWHSIEGGYSGRRPLAEL